MPTLSREQVERYLAATLGNHPEVLRISALGEDEKALASKGYGYGMPLLVEYSANGERRTVVLETQGPGPYGHEHMADRAQMLLWDHRAYNNLPRHVRSLDVGGFSKEGKLRSLGDVEEFFLLTEFVEGNSYINDLMRISNDGKATEADLARADALADYLVEIHSVRGPSPGLYVRRIRELVGHGECVMGLIDGYPTDSGFVTANVLEEIEHKCVAWRWKLKNRVHRLRQVHGDFHPFNILFEGGTDFRVLDRSRGEWGEPADDVTALAINYLFLSLGKHGRMEGAMETLFNRFWNRYLERSGDRELPEVVAPFFAFRGLVVASPVWYPGTPDEVRRKIFSFIDSSLSADSFGPEKINEWCGS